MSLAILTAPFVLNSVQYGANDVIEVSADQLTFITTTLSPAIARAIVAGPAAWAAGSYAINNLVTNNGNYYVNDASVTSGEVPGVDPNWVQVRYLPGTPAVIIPGGSGVPEDGNNYKILDGYLYFKNDDGTAYKVGVATIDGAPAPLIKP